MSEPSLLFLTDAYKYGMWRQTPPGTTEVYSYLSSRGGQFDEVMLVGLQMLIKKHLIGQVITTEDIEIGEEITKCLGGTKFNRAGWEYIRDNYDGRLPLEIKAVPEGLPLPTHNILASVRNTDPKCYWLTTFVEGLLLHTWYPSTVGTLSREIKKLILSSLEKTGTPELIDYKLHDFGFRGKN
jgi:nicotinamide phosphoribosyltransferase